MDDARQQIQPGMKVRITQQIGARDRAWATQVTGTVIAFQQAKTGSWFAHARDRRLWLDRVTLKKDDGEISVLNLDQYSRVDVL